MEEPSNSHREIGVSVKYIFLSFLVAVIMLLGMPVFFILAVNSAELILYLAGEKPSIQLTHWFLTLFSMTYTLLFLMMVVYPEIIDKTKLSKS